MFSRASFGTSSATPLPGWPFAAVMLMAILPLALLAGLTMPWDFVVGSGDYWNYVISDRAQQLTGYLYFVAQPFGPDPLHIPALGLPHGTSLINTDSIVVLTLLGKLVQLLTGDVYVLYGWWFMFCWVMNGVAAMLLSWRAGITDPIRLAAIGLLFGCTPFWFDRWYHFSLMAHFLILLSLDAYLVSARGRWMTGQIYLLLLSIVAATTHIYLWLMIVLVVAATIQHASRRSEKSAHLRCSAHH